MEDVWRGEAQDLLSQIAQLQEENKQLMTNLSHKDVSFSEEEFQKHEGKRRGQPGGGGQKAVPTVITHVVNDGVTVSVPERQCGVSNLQSLWFILSPSLCLREIV